MSREAPFSGGVRHPATHMFKPEKTAARNKPPRGFFCGCHPQREPNPWIDSWRSLWKWLTTPRFHGWLVKFPVNFQQRQLVVISIPRCIGQFWKDAPVQRLCLKSAPKKFLRKSIGRHRNWVKLDEFQGHSSGFSGKSRYFWVKLDEKRSCCCFFGKKSGRLS